MKEIVLKRELLGNKRFNWKQKNFVLSTFSCEADDMELAIRNCKEVGFDMVEQGWMPHDKVWQAVEYCEKYGLDLLFQDMSIMGGMMENHEDRSVPEDVIRGVVEKLKDKKHTIGYYVWDEPYTDKQFTEARCQSDILNKYDPDALLFSVLCPSYNPAPTWEAGEYANCFEEYLKRMDPPVLSFDFYPYGDCCEVYSGYVYDDEHQLDNSVIWLDLATAKKLAAKYKLPFWFYYQADSSVYGTKNLTFPKIRVSMYIATMYGAKGLQSYQAASRHGEKNLLTKSGEKGQFFEETKETFRIFKNLGRTLMALDSKLVYHSDDIVPYGPHAEIYKGMDDSITDSKILCGTLPKRTSVGELEDAYGNRYLMIVNRDVAKDLNATLPMQKAFRVYEVSKKNGNQELIADSATELKVKLQPGEGMLIRIQNVEDEATLISYSL